MTEWDKESALDHNKIVESFSNKQKDKLVNSQGFIMKIGEGEAGVGLLDWYRGDHMNFFPMRSNLEEEKRAIYTYFLKGYVPEAPFITKETYVTSFGSCFAEYFRGWLIEHGYKTNNVGSKRIPIIYMGEGITNTYSLVEQFNWAYGTHDISGEHWIDRDKLYYIPTEEHRQATKDVFEKTDVFVLTCGLSEVWYDKVTQEVYWRGIPKKTFNPDRHGFKLVTVDENFANLDRVVQIIKEKRPKAKIIFSLSPIPLMATFRDIPCESASMISKATLRVALDQIHMKYRDQGVYYWPAFELVKEYCNNEYKIDNRHPTRRTVELVLDQFQAYFVKP